MRNCEPILVYSNPDYHGDATSDMKTVRDVVLGGLCTGCGACSAFCVEDAIVMMPDVEAGIYLPRLDTTRCTECGKCLRVCAGLGVDRAKLAEQISPQVNPNPLLGPVLKCAVGFATDESIRLNASSGGLVTALLIHALETGMIDGAIVTRMKGDSPLEAEPFIARTRDEILEASRSKYCPVPVNKILREVIANDGRYAVVGLPCHIQAIRLAQELDDRVRSRIRLCLGLACHHAPSLLGTEYLVSRLGLRTEDVIKIDYRSGDWPGFMRIATKDGNSVSLPYNSELYWGFLFQRFFYPRRCMMCLDKSSTLSDVSFMDAWKLSMQECEGTGMMIVRTCSGDELVQSCEYAGEMFLTCVPEDSAAMSLDIEAATRARCASIAVFRRRKAAVPLDSGGSVSYWQDRMRARIRMLINALSLNRRLWPILDLFMVFSKSVRRIRRVTHGARSKEGAINPKGKSA